MNPTIKFLAFVFFVAVSMLWQACSKSDEKPATTAPTNVTTIKETNVTSNSATAGGMVGTTGGTDISAFGVCYSKTNTKPTISDQVGLASGNPLVPFSVNLVSLDKGTKYYLCAFASNVTGTTYGNVMDFTTTNLPAPELTTADFNTASITDSSAIGGGNISNDFGSTVTERGICWKLSSIAGEPTINDSKKQMGAGAGSFSGKIGGLNANTTYKGRAYATNSNGTGYGSTVFFETKAGVPHVITLAAFGIDLDSVKIPFQVVNGGGSPIKRVGVIVSLTSNPTDTNGANVAIGNGGIGSTTAFIYPLQGGKTYFARAFASNSVGVGYGNVVTFTTLSMVQVEFKVSMANEIVSASGVHIAGSFQNPQWNPSSTPMNNIGNDVWSYSASVRPNSTVYYKYVNGNAWGLNEILTSPCGTSPEGNRSLQVGTTNTSVIYCYNSCNSSCPAMTVSDVNGNVYPAVKIGNQIWMAQNLMATSLTSGTMHDGNVASFWNNNEETAALWCYANGNSANAATYGLLYNQYAVNTGNLCPVGWHVPSKQEYVTLEAAIGGLGNAGKLKTTNLWQSYTGISSTNSTGFSAVPSGWRDSNQSYFEFGRALHLRTTTAVIGTNPKKSYMRFLNYNLNTFQEINDYQDADGASVRCLKNP